MLDNDEKAVLTKAITRYYEDYVYQEKDNGKASDEDFILRSIVIKLKLDLPQKIRIRF